MDFSETEEQVLLRDNVAKMMNRVATPGYIRKHDQEQAYPYELYDAWVDQGLIALPFAPENGGLGGSVMDAVIVSEEIARKGFDFFTAYGAGIFSGLTVERKGTEAQKRYWLPKLFSGEIKMSTSMSEPDAGSDVGGLRTFAEKDGNSWVINGSKLWASGAGARDNVISTYVRTEKGVPHREGISLFLIPNDTPGMTLRKLDMLGRRSVGTYEIILENVRVPEESVIGGIDQGWNCLLGSLRFERITSSAGYYGCSQTVVDMALQYAKDRKQFGRPIGTNQALAHMLADMQTEVSAGRLLTWYAAWTMAQGQDALLEITKAKLFGSETYVKVASLGMQIMGGYGLNMEFDMQRHFRDSRSVTIGAGTSQMQRNLLANLMGLKIA